MPDAPHSSPDRFTLACRRCSRHVIARTAWVGKTIQCPHCATSLSVPPPPASKRPVTAYQPNVTVRQRFNFQCPCCSSMLESHVGLSGQHARCPTCNARLVVPRLDHQTGVAQTADLLEDKQQDPTPMHAYAASGHLAPRIIRGEDDTLAIQCPRCRAHTDINADACPSCGVPFTTDGMVVKPLASGGETLAGWSFACGIAAVPLFALYLPAALAVLLGLISWFRRAAPAPPGYATAGMVLGTLALAIALSRFL
jgi:hypothetical protein